MEIKIQSTKSGVDITIPDNADYQEIRRALDMAECFLIYGTFLPYLI